MTLCGATSAIGTSNLPRQGLNGGDEQRKKATQEVLYYVLLGTLKLLAPYIPFVTEEVYSYLPGVEGMLITARWPEVRPEYDFSAEAARMEGVMEVIRTVRNLRAEMNVAPGPPRHAAAQASRGLEGTRSPAAEGYFRRLAFASAVEILPADAPNPEKSASAVTGPCELFMPLGELVDVEKGDRPPAKGQEERRRRDRPARRAN